MSSSAIFPLASSPITLPGGLLAGWLELPPAAGLALFTAVLGGTVYATTPKQLDILNTALCVGVGASFVFLLSLAAPAVKVTQCVWWSR
jgi:hypothetical protein